MQNLLKLSTFQRIGPSQEHVSVKPVTLEIAFRKQSEVNLMFITPLEIGMELTKDMRNIVEVGTTLEGSNT